MSFYGGLMLICFMRARGRSINLDAVHVIFLKMKLIGTVDHVNMIFAKTVGLIKDNPLYVDQLNVVIIINYLIQ
jgi:hypothetical protein